MTQHQTFEAQLSSAVNIDRMAKLAKAENAQANFKGNEQGKKRGTIAESEVMAELAKHPHGALIREIADAIHRHPQSVANVCKRMKAKGLIVGREHKAKNNKTATLYRIVR
jgi:DNA-binding MarR family transcriptional regulator